MLYYESAIDRFIRLCLEVFTTILTEAEGNQDWDIVILEAKEAMARLEEL